MDGGRRLEPVILQGAIDPVGVVGLRFDRGVPVFLGVEDVEVGDEELAFPVKTFAFFDHSSPLVGSGIPGIQGRGFCSNVL